jgi:DNA-binding PadR family transcriptional regulator
MWDTVKQQQLNELRRREQEGTLTDEGRQALERLLSQIEQAGWATLQPALERMRQEQKRLQEEFGQVRAQNAVLAALAAQQEDLLARARVQLAGLFGEHEMLKTEYERVTGQRLAASPS